MAQINLGMLDGNGNDTGKGHSDEPQPLSMHRVLGVWQHFQKRCPQA